ncbi:MAG: metal-binding protein [Rubrivivax sp. SCN 70-15]|nr:MAG: metal-binding protein [Rubrivivax sp. SCN 70-15]
MNSPFQARLPRRHFVGLVAALGVARVFAEPDPAVAVQVWKDPNCGCCKDWIVHLERNGFKISAGDRGDSAARARLGMPQKLGSCHTALVQGYVVEGHVPATDIHRLLKDRPSALGLAVPGMPIGSPGMDGPVYGNRRDPYQVLLVQRDGATTVFSNHS